MDRNKVRHKILGILVNNYKKVEDSYGDGTGWLAPMYEDYLPVPIQTVIDRLKISREDFSMVITKAARDKTVEFDELTTGECITIAENTFLFYNEEIYLNQKEKWKDKHPFLYDITIILVTALISVITTLFISKFQREKEQQGQTQINNRQDSLINNLTNSLKVIQSK